MNVISDPIEFVSKIEIMTVTIFGSFITVKFLNALYEHLYEPAIDTIIKTEEHDDYYMKLGNYYVQISAVVKEFFKWALLLILIMIIYNVVKRYKKNKN